VSDATTTRYLLTKPEVGASADTWGTKWNTNLDGVDKLLGAITTAGSSNAYTLTSGQSLTAYVSGMSFIVRWSFGNTSTATINVDGIGAKALTKNGTTALASGDLPQDTFARITYDGTQFQVMGASSGLYQPLDATLTAIAALSTSSDTYIRATGTDTFAVDSVTTVTSKLNAVVGDSGSGGTKGLVPAPSSGDAAAGKFLKADGTWATASSFPTPGGRLTLTSATPVLSSDVTGATTLYYAIYNHNQIPLSGGSSFTTTTFSELTNDTTASSTGKAGPAACTTEACYDLFVWLDSSTVRLTRGPNWTKAATFTVTIATPGVVTQNAHGLRAGAPWIPTTSGALPTGLTAGTTYYVGKNVTTNTFSVSTTLANALAGTYVTTSGSQSGTHTGTNRDTDRGTGSGTTELTTLNGVRVNKYDITNGPTANRGLYVGTIRTNGSSQVDWKATPAAGTGGGGVYLGLWNAYNQVDVIALSLTSTTAYTYSSTIRPHEGNVNALMQVCVGLQQNACKVLDTISCYVSGTQEIETGVLYDDFSVLPTKTVSTWNRGSTTDGHTVNPVAQMDNVPAAGFHYYAGAERSTSGSSTFYGTGTGFTITGIQSGVVMYWSA
jgi:hypothetical protein